MKKWMALSAVLALVGVSLIGCGGKTDEAADATKTAAGNAADATKSAAGTAADATKGAVGTATDAAKGATDTAMAAINDKISEALKAEPTLKDAAIQVEMGEKAIFLKGEVASNELKKKATEIAEKYLTDNSITQKIMNQLTVKAH